MAGRGSLWIIDWTFGFRQLLSPHSLPLPFFFFLPNRLQFLESDNKAAGKIYFRVNKIERCHRGCPLSPLFIQLQNQPSEGRYPADFSHRLPEPLTIIYPLKKAKTLAAWLGGQKGRLGFSLILLIDEDPGDDLLKFRKRKEETRKGER